jgi:hypothetical protein
MGVHHKTTEKQRAEIVRRYAAGENICGIARDYRISHAMVSHYARAAGMPSRRPRRQRLKEGWQNANA